MHLTRKILKISHVSSVTLSDTIFDCKSRQRFCSIRDFGLSFQQCCYRSIDLHGWLSFAKFCNVWSYKLASNVQSFLLFELCSHCGSLDWFCSIVMCSETCHCLLIFLVIVVRRLTTVWDALNRTVGIESKLRQILHFIADEMNWTFILTATFCIELYYGLLTNMKGNRSLKIMLLYGTYRLKNVDRMEHISEHYDMTSVEIPSNFLRAAFMIRPLYCFPDAPLAQSEHNSLCILSQKLADSWSLTTAGSWVASLYASAKWTQSVLVKATTHPMLFVVVGRSWKDVVQWACDTVQLGALNWGTGRGPRSRHIKKRLWYCMITVSRAVREW